MKREKQASNPPNSASNCQFDALFSQFHVVDEETDFPVGTWDVTIAALNTEGEGPVSNTVTVTVG